MSEILPQDPAALPTPPPVPAELSRSELRRGYPSRAKRVWSPMPQAANTRTHWRHGLGFSAAVGALLGAAWWLLAPGGAFYGDGEDYTVWFPRDLVLAILMVTGGLLSAVWLLRQRRVTAHGPLPAAAFVAMVVGGFVGSVIAWRMGVFAGDLFHTPANNLPHPSMVFSLRSQTVLILWPLASVITVFIAQLFGYGIYPAAPAPGQDAPAQDAPGQALPSNAR
ncbi:hypothetical protein [Arthrobacter sp. HLT1-20]